ncbi:MAG: UvrD-helicase domain-containing protein [Erysipelotrichaceae bacterium]|nr:UvrD-helicase domain-containing protein [Erysipelotrichaceae bacterium]
MMAEKWTDQQRKAFSRFGHNIVVSAGAGSGKTAVLSERVYRLTGEHKIDIDRLLVLTFTNKAAAEMKKRIRDKITLDEGRLFESEEEKFRQINKIDSSYVMTFDAYAQSLVKKYHYLLDADRNIGIIDNNVLKTETENILNELMLEKYRNEDLSFIRLIEDFCIKNDNPIREAVLNINRELDKIYEREEYVKTYVDRFFAPEKLDDTLREYTETLKVIIARIRSQINELSEEVDTDLMFRNMDPLFQSNTYSEIRESASICEPSGSKLPRGVSDRAKELNQKIKEELKDLKKLTAQSEEELKQEILDTKDYSVCLLGLAQELNSRLKEFKKLNSLYSFADVFRMSIDLVNDHEEIRSEIAQSFIEILIDEYQDTNDLQEEFINRIAHDNVYMVGDIKQSIYRFRNANPELFKYKYETFLKDDDHNELIELPHNFRSRKEVLEDIDVIFDKLMDSKIGGADFKKAHHMKAGRSDAAITGQNQHMEILSYVHDKKEYPFDSFDKHEVEAFITAQDILQKISEGYKVRDFIEGQDNKKEEIIRKASYRDFCILIDRKTNFDLYKKILSYYNIPVVIERDETMSDSDLSIVVKSIFNLLVCIDEERKDELFRISYASLARSFLVEMSDSELYDIITQKRYENTDLYQKLFRIHEGIEYKTISMILDEIIDTFDIYNSIRKIGMVHENMVKIDYFYQLAHSLNQIGYDYRSFGEYLSNAFDGSDENDITFSIDSDDEDAVRIINIHKSKGLEYNICYYVGLDVAFNQQDLKDRIVFSKDLGIILPVMIPGRGLKETVKKAIYKNEYTLKDIGEKIRLLYVALTRTKEKMVVVCPLQNDSETGQMVSELSRLSFRNFNDMFSSVYDDLYSNKLINELDLNRYAFTRDYLDKKIDPILSKTDRKIDIIPFEKIEAKKILKSRFSKDSGLISSKTLKKMEMGTRLHYYLETLNFLDPDYTVIEEEYKEYIRNFMESDLMKDVSKGKAYKEYEFIYEEDNEKKHGFIDLLMEYDDRFDIIDYKTKNIDDEHYDEQLNGYRKYIESVSSKKVDCYLYSILEGEYRKIVSDK